MTPAVQLSLKAIETKDRPIVPWPVSACVKHPETWADDVVEEAGVLVPLCKACLRGRR